MSSPKASRPAPELAGCEPREFDLPGRQIGSIATPQKIAVQVIRAEIVGEDRSEAEGLSARGVLALCRSLIAAGFDPARPLHAYRGRVPCLEIRSLRAGAALTVDESRIAFVRWKAFPHAAVSPRIASARHPAITLAAGVTP